MVIATSTEIHLPSISYRRVDLRDVFLLSGSIYAQ